MANDDLPGRVPVHDDRPAWLNIMQRVFFALVVRPFLVLFVGLRVRGRENLPAADPFILIANHSSHIDAVALLSLFPGKRLRRIRPVAAADYFERNRFIGWLTRALFHTLPIERDARSPETDPRPHMLAALALGQSLILFPEGTRGHGTDLGHFRRGIAWLAERRPDIPIVPAYLENMGRALPKGEFLPVPVFCGVRLGPPLFPRGSTEEILQVLEGAVLQLRDGEQAAPHSHGDRAFP
jgi:1-acyl-sn-glycerol-3-phosphate acyltransferase